MDYSVLKNLAAGPRDGLDLTLNTYTTNNNNNVMSPHHDPDRIYTKYSINHSTHDPSPRLTPNSHISDTDEPMDGRRSSTTTPTNQPPPPFAHQPHQHVNLPDTTKLKLKFSVDRILGRDTDTTTVLHQYHRHEHSSIGYDMMHSTRDQCLDCNHSASSGRDGTTAAGSTSPSVYTVPFSVASMLGLSNNGKSIVRPMAVRYMQRSAGVPSSQTPQSAAYKIPSNQYDHYHQHHHQSSRHPVALYKANSSQSLDRRPLHQSSITIVDNPTIGTANANNNANKRKRSWSRAVFSQLQRKGLEIQFQIQKYITKPDRRKLAARLLLTDAQVKVWFQNRRMKWRHTRETKLNQEKAVTEATAAAGGASNRGRDGDDLMKHETSSSSDEDEIDVVAE